MLKKIVLSISLFLLVVPVTGFSSGPYSYSGSGGSPDSKVIQQPDVVAGQTQWVSMYLDTHSAFENPNMHLAIVLRGAMTSHEPIGRGVALGTTTLSDGSLCKGIVVENFTVHAGPSNGLVTTSCRAHNFKEDTSYKLDIVVTDTSVHYTLRQRMLPFGYVLVAIHTCTENLCTLAPGGDGNSADIAVGSAVLPEGNPWRIAAWIEGRY